MSGSTGIATNSANPSQRIFRITDIPDVMQFKKGWPVAARLMRRWFAGPSYQMTKPVKENWDGMARTMPRAVVYMPCRMMIFVRTERATVVVETL